MKTIFYNGRVYTGEDRLAEAFAVENGRILAVGTDREMLALRQCGDEKFDLSGRFVSPGFNDSHMHLLGYGASLSAAQLADHTDSLAGMIEYAKGFALARPPRPGQWIKGRGWNQDYFADENRMPNRYDLDKISRAAPVLLTRACGHVCAVNSRALEMAGITAQTPSPEGGAIGIKDGQPDGLLYDNAINLIDDALPTPDKAEIKDMIRLACRELNRRGVTSVQTDDYCAFRQVPWQVVNEAYRELAESGELTVRVCEQANFTELDGLEGFTSAGCVTGAGNHRFKIGPLKLLGDGSLGGRTAYLSRPYADDASTRGFPLFSPEQMNQLVDFAHRRGMSVAVHAIGDACLDQALDAIELALQKNPRSDHRHGVVHCQISRADQLDRMIRLGVHIYAQSIFLDYDNHIVKSRVGPDLAATSYSWKTLMDGGLSVSNGSDCPVELPNVMEGMECAVTRMSLDGVGPYLPHQAFTPRQALDSFTIRGAEASFEETVKGLIRPGFLADFTVLSDDPMAVEPREIHNIEIVETYLGGEKVYG